MHVRVRARVRDRVRRAAAWTAPPGARMPYYRLWVRVIRSGRAADAGGPGLGWGEKRAERVRRGLCAHEYSRREGAERGAERVHGCCILGVQMQIGAQCTDTKTPRLSKYCWPAKLSQFSPG